MKMNVVLKRGDSRSFVEMDISAETGVIAVPGKPLEFYVFRGMERRNPTTGLAYPHGAYYSVFEQVDAQYVDGQKISNKSIDTALRNTYEYVIKFDYVAYDVFFRDTPNDPTDNAALQIEHAFRFSSRRTAELFVSLVPWMAKFQPMVRAVSGDVLVANPLPQCISDMITEYGRR